MVVIASVYLSDEEFIMYVCLFFYVPCVLFGLFDYSTEWVTGVIVFVCLSIIYVLFYSIPGLYGSYGSFGLFDYITESVIVVIEPGCILSLSLLCVVLYGSNLGLCGTILIYLILVTLVQITMVM